MKLFRSFAGAIRRLFRRPRIRECLAVLPVIGNQLRETSRQVEESVVRVCGNFTEIAARARETVAESITLLDGGSGDGATVESSIETSRRTIASLLERMERATDLSAMAVASMEEVTRTVTGIEELLAQVQRIAFTNKLVALNAKIEAVHVGELGAGFEVVAEEISRQADRSNQLAEEIASRIREMCGRVDGVAEDLRGFLAQGRQKLGQSRSESDSALTMLWGLHQRSRDLLARNSQENSRLASEIASAVVGLQFQDRVKQRVEHVIEALDSMARALGAHGQEISAGSASGQDLLASVHSSYTMESERAAHNQATNQTAAPPADQEMEVELF